MKRLVRSYQIQTSNRGNLLEKNPIRPYDSKNLFDELKKELNETQKLIINQIIQGRTDFLNYTFKDAVTELDDLFDSK